MSGSEPALETTSLPAGKALVRCLVEEGVNEGWLPVFDKVLVPRDPGRAGSHGPAGLKELLSLYREAVPDAHWTVDEQIAEGEVVVTCVVASGQQRGLLWGIPATGNQPPRDPRGPNWRYDERLEALTSERYEVRVTRRESHPGSAGTL